MAERANNAAGLVGDLRELLAKAGVTEPWAYRPEAYDDWGFIRSGDGDNDVRKPVIAVSCEAVPSDHDAHRWAGTDPYRPVGELIVAAINALPGLLAEREALRAALEPFARWADYIEREGVRFQEGDDGVMYASISSRHGADVRIMASDLRRARAALQPTAVEGEGL